MAPTIPEGVGWTALVVDEGPPDTPTRWLGACGWTVDEWSTVREQVQRLRRPVPAIMDPDRDGIDTWLACAHR